HSRQLPLSPSGIRLIQRNRRQISLALSLNRSDDCDDRNTRQGELARAGSFFYIVAVGTTIADRPPHRSVRARLRIRLLPWMSNGKTLLGVWMQHPWDGNPAIKNRCVPLPRHPPTLAAPSQNGPP